MNRSRVRQLPGLGFSVITSLYLVYPVLSVHLLESNIFFFEPSQLLCASLVLLVIGQILILRKQDSSSSHPRLTSLLLHLDRLIFLGHGAEMGGGEEQGWGGYEIKFEDIVSE